MTKKKVSPIVYITCGTAVTAAMITIKIVGWVLHKAVVVFLLHE